MEKVTKSLERALTALQLANNEIEHLRIMKRELPNSNSHGALLGEIKSQICTISKTVTPVG